MRNLAIRHSITLSTSEPNNEVGNLKIRQGDEQTQTLVANITENGVPKPFTGLQPFFCAKLGQTAGLGIIEQKVTGTMNPANGTLEYVMQPEDWQQLGRQTAYFSFRKMVNDHEWTEQFSTRDFNYNVIKSAFSEGLREVKKDGSTYIWTIEDMMRLFKEYIATGKVEWENYKNDERTIWETYRLAEKINWDDYKLREKNEWKNYKDDEKTTWEKFVEDNREFLENADPGGKIILELLGGRGGFDSLSERLDSEKAEVVKLSLLNTILHQEELKYIAHRGVDLIAPENTLQSFDLAGQLGYWAIETDLHQTLDGEWLTIHDPTFDRTTNGVGGVKDKMKEYADNLVIDSGANIVDYPNEKIPTLAEYLTICKKHNAVAMMEIKVVNMTAEKYDSLLSELKKCGFIGSSILCSFNYNDLREIRVLDKTIALGYLSNYATTTEIDACKKLGNACMLVSTNGATKQAVNLVHSYDLKIGVWTVDDDSSRQLYVKNGVDFIITGWLK